MMKFGLLGSGSWGTALAKLLTDNKQAINWCLRNEEDIHAFRKYKHNPQYLRSAVFDTRLLEFSTDAASVIAGSDVILIVIPSAYIKAALSGLDREVFQGKKILSAVKGILPGDNMLLNDYLEEHFDVPLSNYFTVLGPCHAEEVAQEKLSYLTFSGLDPKETGDIAKPFATYYLKTLHNRDVIGAQYAAVLKNIYAIGSGMAHALEYGDNFLSVLIANSADEMAGFLRKSGQQVEVGSIVHTSSPENEALQVTNYAASVYLGDLLVTCYSPFSRNRTFGNMIGKGYSVQTAQLEMNMIAEGYNASKCVSVINETVQAEMPIADAIYDILWNGVGPREGFAKIESVLV